MLKENWSVVKSDIYKTAHDISANAVRHFKIQTCLTCSLALEIKGFKHPTTDISETLHQFTIIQRGKFTSLNIPVVYIIHVPAWEV